MSKFDTINNDIENDIPDLSFEISSKIDWVQVKEDNKHKGRVREREFVGVGATSDVVVFKSNKRRNIFTAAAIMVAIFALVMIFVFVPMGNQEVGNTGYTLTISVNPRVSFDVNDSGIVTKQVALNADGAKVLFGVDHKGKTYLNATTDFITTAERMGYISAGDNVSIYASNGKKNDKEKVTSLSQVLKELIDGVNFGAMTEADFDKIEDQLEDFDEDQFSKENMDNLIAGVKAELEKKTLMLKGIISEADKILVNKVKLINNAVEKDSDSNEEIIPDSQLVVLKKLVNEYVVAYNDEDLKELNFSELSYEELGEIRDDLFEENVELEETRAEVNEITDINQVGEDKKDIIEDLLDIVKDDIFDKD